MSANLANDAHCGKIFSANAYKYSETTKTRHQICQNFPYHLLTVFKYVQDHRSGIRLVKPCPWLTKV